MRKVHRIAYPLVYVGLGIFVVFLWIGSTYMPTDRNDMEIKSLLEDIRGKIVAEKPICKVNGLTSTEEFFEYFNKTEYECKEPAYFGVRDGMKTVCMDPEFELTPGNCNVLSFGINYEWSFDEAFDKFGCKVYSFDPTMDKEDYQRSENIMFFKLGIGNIQGKRRVGMYKFDMHDVDRYENIVEHLGLTNSVIDYLKLDVEISELDFLHDITRNSPHLLKNIRQLCIELHHGKEGQGIKKVTNTKYQLDPTSAFVLFWEYFQELKCHGFKLTTTIQKRKMTEVVWSNFKTV